LRFAAVGLIALAACGAIAALGASVASAAKETKERQNHCVVPSGVDLNELWGVSEQIVTGSSPSCSEVGSGERWRPSVAARFMNHQFEVVPDGFLPAGQRRSRTTSRSSPRRGT
jgi:hypothetical protein